MIFEYAYDAETNEVTDQSYVHIPNNAWKAKQSQSYIDGGVRLDADELYAMMLMNEEDLKKLILFSLTQLTNKTIVRSRIRTRRILDVLCEHGHYDEIMSAVNAGVNAEVKTHE